MPQVGGANPGQFSSACTGGRLAKIPITRAGLPIGWFPRATAHRPRRTGVDDSSAKNPSRNIRCDDSSGVPAIMTNPTPDDLDEPPPPESRVWKVGLVGIGLAFAALVLGLAGGAPRRGFEAHDLDGPRMLLCAAAMVVAGSAAALRPLWYGGWACLVAVGLTCHGVGRPAPAGQEWFTVPERDWYAAVPNSWDSIQVFCGIGAALAVVAIAATMASRKLVFSLLFVAIAYHWAGILSAVTSTYPTPWLTDQYWKRVSHWYLQFAYLNNAYQFYSPDPGPASEIWFCIEYKTAGSSVEEAGSEANATTAKAPKDADWVMTPRRRLDYLDPLGLTYYRRLSLSEQLAQFAGPNNYFPDEEYRVKQRRVSPNVADKFPKDPSVIDQTHFHQPNDIIVRQILPSYARHAIAEYADPDKVVKSVRIYRVTHAVPELDQFRARKDAQTGAAIRGISPFDPILYLPYFQGEFDPTGKLVDSTEPLLYWLLLTRQIRLPLDPNQIVPTAEYDKYYIDYVSLHAGSKRPKE